jgi:hypothetical protein
MYRFCPLFKKTEMYQTYSRNFKTMALPEIDDLNGNGVKD